jgi:pimeloyl-ACP methyl ester carboxylesterase
MNFVFVPGAWHSGWSWHPVGTRVRAAGHAAVALTLPGLTMGDDPRGLRLADAVDHIVREVERRDLRDVVLVGHSFAGIPITGAARRLAGRLARIAFYSAFIPRAGESMADAMDAETAAYLRAVISSSPEETVSVDFDSFRTALMQDEPEELQRLVYDQLVPQPGGYMLDSPDAGGEAIRALGIPVTYLLAEHDRALAAPGAELAARAGVTPVMVPGTHEALLTHPDDVAKALLQT